jgi:signal transduction histidine kinase
VAEGELTLDVLDDGVGIPADRDRSSGLANLRRRPAHVDGSAE